MKHLLILFSLLAVQTCHRINKDTTTALSLTSYELKLRLIDKLGAVDYCDRDMFPVVRPQIEQAALQKFFDTVKLNSEEITSISSHLGLQTKTEFTADEKLAIYRQHKALLVITLDSVPIKFSFNINVKTAQGEEWHYEGQISPSGQITVALKKPFKLNCPICLPYNALIETPNGSIKVADLKVDDPVFSADVFGTRFVTIILTVGRTPVSSTHQMIHIKLKDGREFTASFGHPLADGRTLSQLNRSDLVQKSIVMKVDTVNYTGGYTYDILPKGETGFYFVNGILVGSTFKNNALITSEKNF